MNSKLYRYTDSEKFRIILDLSSPELEYKNGMFPANILFDGNKREDWAEGFKEFFHYSDDIKEKYKRFRSEILDPVTKYKLPVITMDATTPKEAVCEVFENVNTGGVQLTVFELVTACFAADGFNLREDWEKCRKILTDDGQLNSDILNSVDETAFLTAITLYTSHQKESFTSCKKNDVLRLTLDAYRKNRDILLDGFQMARVFLFSQSVFLDRDLPYATQLIPLASICADIGHTLFEKPHTREILATWYWCGIMGEMYGGANETRYANDIDDITLAIRGKESPNRTIRDAHFSAARLLSMQSRLSAAYKGVMALLYHENCMDFIHGITMDVVKSMVEAPDIHHIFPEAYCRSRKFPREKWNSIVNKTPLLPASNRAIGGKAPSAYCEKILRENPGITPAILQERIESHKVNYEFLVTDDFDKYFIERAKRLLNMIEKAMGKEISDRSSEQVITAYGQSLE